MPLIYSAIVPHSPVLIPKIGKELSLKLGATIHSLQRIADKLQRLEPECIVVISSHSVSKKDSQDLYLAVPPECYTASYEQFGDLESNYKYPTDHVLADTLKREFVNHAVIPSYRSEERMDYTVSTPLFFLYEKLNAKIVILHIPESASPFNCEQYGTLLKNALQSTSKTCALIASANLSHRLTLDAPGGFSEDAKNFDEQWVATLRYSKKRKITPFQTDAIQHVAACGIPAILTLLGSLKNLSYRTKFYSYEGNVGVGHVVIEYTF